MKAPTYIEAALTATLATLGSFGLLAVIVFSVFGYEKITELVIKGQLKNVNLEEMIKRVNQLCSEGKA